MRELSLFSGAGGGLLGSLLLGWTTVGYVEFNDYCQRVIAQRIKDGYLHNAPIFSDIRAFISEGYAERYRGMVDVVSGGFPCQPFSVAGKQAAADDPRNMWPATRDVIRIVRPGFVFLENVPGLLGSHGYFGDILGQMASMGYDARWGIMGARHSGAPHKRDRLWVYGYSHSNWESTQPEYDETSWMQGVGKMSNPQIPGLEGEREGLPGFGGWWAVEPNVGRVANGVASRVDRLKAIGNGQVPAVAATAWRLLTSD